MASQTEAAGPRPGVAIAQGSLSWRFPFPSQCQRQTHLGIKEKGETQGQKRTCKLGKQEVRSRKKYYSGRQSEKASLKPRKERTSDMTTEWVICQGTRLGTPNSSRHRIVG